jgi:hypothetical protein
VTKIFTGYEILLLKYPNSHLVDSETKPTSKISMATDYNFHTMDNVDTVLEHMENQMPGFERLFGSYEITEPTYRNGICADETAFVNIFQSLEKASPCVYVYIFPSDGNGASIKISEKWCSLGFPRWLKMIP